MPVPPDTQRDDLPHRIFISYRRDDSLAHSVHLRADLARHFGEHVVFMDINSIEPGTIWRREIESAAVACPVMLVVIGRQWATITEPGTDRRRLDNPNDVLRQEVALALLHSPRVVPVLVDGAFLPRADELPDDLRPLLEREAYALTADDWDYKVSKLIASLENVVDTRPHVSAQQEAAQAAYTTPAVGVGIMFSVNPEARDVLIAWALILSILIILGYLVYRSYQTRQA